MKWKYFTFLAFVVSLNPTFPIWKRFIPHQGEDLFSGFCRVTEMVAENDGS